ncbi:uncharacterized protein IUM83_01050 [Phytophthora cinnamomi]|uniref:uncharacterized protein n=1 Tax=Phytophthora cinnamomi TaxID=4785 RepID=UPI00355A9169|nr:hypothetical protein IUM83_01050 [Phytophthora cinnamomi]
MAFAIGAEVESLQATLDFIADYDLSPTGDETAVLDVIDEDSALLALGDDLEFSSEDDVSRSTFTTDKFRFGDKSAVVKGSPTSSHGDVTSLIANAPWPQLSPQPNKRRRRGPPRKEEIADLRRSVTKLSKKLETLQLFAKVDAAASVNAESNAEDLTLWRGLASRQLALRRSAESVNATLRSEIVAQAKYAANLKRMLKRRYSEEMLELVPIVNRGRTVEHKASGDNQRIHDNLLEGTDDIYASVDALFEKKGMDQVPCPGTTKQTYTSTVNGVFLELMSKNQVPFDLRSTTRAVWKSFQGQKMRDGDHVQTKVCVQDVKLTDSVITSYMSYTCNAAGHSSYVQERRVARKYVEADRSVFVSRSLTDPTSRSAGFLGLLFQESLVVVVRRGQPLASGQKTSVIECYLWVTRCDDGKEEAVQFRKPKFTDLAVSGWDSKLSLLSQRIENILFDEPIGSM